MSPSPGSCDLTYDPKSSRHTDDIQYVTSQKGRIQLLSKGFYYVREKKIRNKVYWRCTQYTTWFRCHGRLHTENGQIVHGSTHNHGSAQEGEKPNMRKLKSKKMFMLQNQQTQQTQTQKSMMQQLMPTAEHYDMTQTTGLEGNLLLTKTPTVTRRRGGGSVV